MATKTSSSSAVRNGYHRLMLTAGIVAVFALTLGGCATQTKTGMSDRSPTEGDKIEQSISSALLDGKPVAARESIAAALRAHPQNGYLHLLNGLSYQLQENSLQSLELARVGYGAAVNFAPGYFWGHYLAGSAALESQDYHEAAEQFSNAILNDPDNSRAFLGLAASAYFAGDLEVAQTAAERAVALSPKDPMVVRAAAYVAAAHGDRDRLDLIQRKAEAFPEAARELKNHKGRFSQLLRTAAMDRVQSGSDKPLMLAQAGVVGSGAPAEIPKQVMVEVTMLLSQSTTNRKVGINLLDGLSLQFSGSNATERRQLSRQPDTFARTITTALQVPQITYSLNLFNTRDEYYDVVVRPSLVASLGQPSEFFIGRQATVGVSGINLGSLQPIDIGTTVKITPSEISAERTKFRVDTIRSFQVTEAAGSFQQALTTFKQTVGGTVEVEFGKTLILSGLYEGVDVATSSRVPLLGDIPVVDTLFNARTKMVRRDAALVLVTPKLVGVLQTDTKDFRSDTLNKLLAMWKELVDPAVNMDAIMKKVERKTRRHFQPQTGDLKLPSVANRELVKSVVEDTVGRLN